MKQEFSAKLQRWPGQGGWTYLVPTFDSKALFGTGGLVKCQGTIDGEPFESSLMPMGNGRHMLPVKAAIRKVIGKEAGSTVSVMLEARP